MSAKDGKKSSIPRPNHGTEGRPRKSESDSHEESGNDTEWNKLNKSRKKAKAKGYIQGPFRPSIVGKREAAERAKAAKDNSKQISVKNEKAKPGKNPVDSGATSGKRNDDHAFLGKKPQQMKSKGPHPVAVNSHISPLGDKKIEELKRHIQSLEARLSEEQDKVDELEQRLQTMEVHERLQGGVMEEKKMLEEKVKNLENTVKKYQEALENNHLDPISCETLSIDEETVMKEQLSARTQVKSLRATVLAMLGNNQAMVSELQDLIKASS